MDTENIRIYWTLYAKGNSQKKGRKRMSKKVLIAYGTAAGSTAEVAQAVGEEMEKAGAAVDVKPVEMVENINGYDAVVVGSSVRAFHILAKTRRFMRKFKQDLRDVPAAFFGYAWQWEKINRRTSKKR